MKAKGAGGRLWSTAAGIVAFVVAAGIAIAVNVIVGNFNVRADLTEAGLYSLSEGTRHIIGGLKEPVTLKFYFNGPEPYVPVFLKNYGRQIEDLLKEYELASKGKIKFLKYNPAPDSDAEDWAERYGVQGQPLTMSGPNLFMGLVAEVGDVHDTLPFLNPGEEENLEYDITRLIIRVASPSKPVVGVMSSLPVLGSRNMGMMFPGQRPPTQDPWALFQYLKEDYDVRELSMDEETIDPAMPLLVIVHPRSLPDKTLYAIDQFVLGGGRLLVFMDPFCAVESESSPAQPFAMPAAASDLGRLLAKGGPWGVEFDSENAVADAGAEFRGNPVLLRLYGESISREDVLTSSLEVLFMVVGGSFSGAGTKDLAVTPLAVSSPNSGLVSAMMARMGTEAVRNEFRIGHRKLNLAVRLKGKFKTAFPEGKPGDGAEEAGSTNAPAAPKDKPAPGLAEGESTVVLVGDADMLHDRFQVIEEPYGPGFMRRVRTDNLNFFANAVEQLAQGSELMAVRTRGKTDRPFKKVRDLRSEAEEALYDQDRDLQEQLQETERRLGELQEKKDESQAFVLSPEQKVEIDRLLEKSAKIKEEQKKVRRERDSVIRRLGVVVKVVNILLMPAVVIVGGISFGVFRRLRAKG